MTLSMLAIKNLLRKRVRSIAIVLAAALASGLIFSASTILGSVKKSLELGIKRLGADIMVVPAGYEAKGRKALLAGEPTSFYMDRKNLDRIKAVSGVEKASSQLFMASAVLECCYAPNILLVGYDPETDFTVKPWIRLSVPGSKSTEKLSPVTMGGNLGYLSTDDLRFFGKQFRLGSLLYPTGLGFLDSAVFMTMDTARDMITISKSRSRRPLDVGPDQISSVLVKVGRDFDIHKVAADIENTLPGVAAIVTSDLVTTTRRYAETALWSALALGAVCWALMLVATGLVFAMSVNERQREFGVLRAMGAKKRHVFRLILSEASILSGLGAGIGVGLGLVIIANFKKLIIVSLGNIQFLWQPLHSVAATGAACILLMIVSGAVCAALPAARTCRKEPYEAICTGMR